MRRQQTTRGPMLVAFVTVAVIAAGVTVAFNGGIPFTHHFTIYAETENSVKLDARAPVRIAGVRVGEVTAIEPRGDGRPGSRIALRVDEGGPLHTDAQVKIRERTALEGNEYVDLMPGSPSAPELGDGGTIPPRQVAGPVQLDQVLGALDSSTRDRLVTAVDEYGRALSGRGGEGFRDSIRYWRPAYRDIALVNMATLGERTHDLSGFVASAGGVADALDKQPPAVRALIGRFDETAGALDAERGSLRDAVAELPATLDVARASLASVDRMLPRLDRLAVALRPTVREAVPTIDMAEPFLAQLRALVAPAELQGLAHDLRPTVPALARLNRNLPPFLSQLRAASSCQDEVILPWARDTVPDADFPPAGPVFEEFIRGALPGLSGESRSGDANGQWFTPAAVSGTNVIALGDGRFATTALPALGVNPARPDSRPPLRPNVPCETQETPDLSSKAVAPPQQFQLGLSTPAARARFDAARLRAIGWLRRQLKRERLDGAMRVSDQDLTPEQLHSLPVTSPGTLGGIRGKRP